MRGRWLPWAPVPALPGPALVLAWARASLTRLAAHRPELDGINVFPVADADTGTNLLLTMRSAVDAVEAAAVGPDAVAGALARGALLGACGNSGVILSQVLRGLAEAVAATAGCGQADPRGERAAAVLADALSRGVALASAALTDPREGTALTVLAAAAAAAHAAASRPAPLHPAPPHPAPHPAVALEAGAYAVAPSGEAVAAAGTGGGALARAATAVAAAGTGGDALARAATAAAEAAEAAVRATTAQLPELGRAGVVDAGGMGVYLL